MNKNRIKWLAAILITALFITAVPGLAAEKNNPKQNLHHQTMALIQEGALIAIENKHVSSQSLCGRTRTIDNETIRTDIYTNLLMMSPEIDLSDYHIPYEDFQIMIQDLMNSSAELFHVDASYSVMMDSSSTYALTYIPTYKYEANTVAEMRTAFDAAVMQILSGVNPEWSDREKALYVHDYLVSQCEYDTSMQKFDAYSLLVDGTAVCQGYTLAYNYLMERMGIPCASVPSDEMAHIWNQIELDGEWYHVDMTYDDTGLPYDIPGMAMHENFLLSDQGIQKTEHYNWTSNYKCSSQTYDNDDYFWKTSHAPFQNDGTTWFFMKNLEDARGHAGLYEWNPSDDTTGLLIDLSGEMWYSASFNRAYKNKYAGLALSNGQLYFNTPTQIQSVPADDLTTCTPVELPDLSGLIFGLRIKNNFLEYACGSEADEEFELLRAKELEAPVSSYEWPSPAPLPTPVPPSSSAPAPTLTPTQLPGQTPAATPSAIPDKIPGSISTVTPGQPATSQTPATGVRSVTVTSVPPQQTPNAANISITAKKGAKKLTVRVPSKTKTVISMNKKIMKNKKKLKKKITVPATKNKNGKIQIALSSRLKKKMRITVTVYQSGRKTTKKVTIS